MRRTTASRLAGLGLLAGLMPLVSGCSILSPEPTWELIKATGGLTALALSQAQPKASNTVYHLHSRFSSVCIAFNPRTQIPDIVPALQSVLQDRGIDSKVYDNPAATRQCPVWLEYSAHFEWGVPPLSSEYRRYISSAHLTLRSDKGQVLSTSEYQLDGLLGLGKWSDTRAKMNSVVGALLTGFQT